jgi:long-chain acyl-CoA synthetase
VFLGYYKQPEVTKETITADGWLKTGDVAEIHPENKGFKIIDRKKNIFKLQQGEYLAPDRIEGYYAKCSLLSEVFLHGDSHQAFAVAVVTPNKG